MDGNFDVTVSADNFKLSATQEDLLVPYFKIIQSLSNELIIGKDKYNENLKAGDIYDSITKISFRKANVIVCGIRRYYTEWTPEVRGKILGKHFPNSDVVNNAQKIEKQLSNGSLSFSLKTQSGNELQETYCVVLLIKNENGMIFPGKLILSKSSYIVGKELSAVVALYQNSGMPIFELTTILTSNSKGSWYKPSFNFVNFETDKNIINLAISLNKSIDKIVFG